MRRGEGGVESIEFYGIGIDSPYDAERAYWLVDRGGSGPRVGAPRPAQGAVPAPASFPFTVERKDRTVAFLALTNNGDTEDIFGDLVSSDPVSLAITTSHLDRGATWPSTLTIALQGATTGVAHEVEVRVNGSAAGTVAFSNQDHVEQAFSVPQDWLREGDNEVTLVATGAGDDVSIVDYVRLTYAHRYVLDGGALRLTAPGDRGDAARPRRRDPASRRRDRPRAPVRAAAPFRDGRLRDDGQRRRPRDPARPRSTRSRPRTPRRRTGSS